MLRMLRRNVLVRLKLEGDVASDVIVIPEKYLRKSQDAVVVAFAPSCMEEWKVGQRVIIEPKQDAERTFSPGFSEAYGLERAWHLILHEAYVEAAI